VASILLPGERFQGAPLKDGSRRTYTLNGLLVQLLAMVGYVVGSEFVLGLWRSTIIYEHYGALLTTTLAWSFVLSTYLYVRAKFLPKKEQNYRSNDLITNFWCGVELNPEILGFEIKFWSYRPGFILMSLINISSLAKQYHEYGEVSLPMLVFQVISFLYVFDAFWYEGGMVYMFDIIEENFGLMLVFGDYTWIPFAFSLQSLYLIDKWDIHVLYVVLIATVFVTGYRIFRGNNFQKLQFRLNPDKLIDGKKPETISTGNPNRGLLVSGWWGIARKINYLGDIMIAISMSMPCGTDYLLPWLYPIYLTLLLIDRAKRDDHRCREKYGEHWKQYCARVKWVMIPYVY